MKKREINWKEDGWTVVQEADEVKHILEISCRTEKGTVVEVRVRHNDGEEAKGNVTLNGEKVLPMSLADFKAAYLKGTLLIK